jgi:membrane protein YqaA with SNARE-associated domain
MRWACCYRKELCEAVSRRTALAIRRYRQLETLRRHGAPALLLAWAPVIGDALCAAAGWLRLPWLSCMIWMALGKGARYALIASGVSMV